MDALNRGLDGDPEYSTFLHCKSLDLCTKLMRLEDVDDGVQNFGHSFPPHHLSFMSCMVNEIRGFSRHVLF